MTEIDPRDAKMIKGMRSREELTKDYYHNPKSCTFEVLLDLRELLQKQVLTETVNTTGPLGEHPDFSKMGKKYEELEEAVDAAMKKGRTP